MWAGGLQDWASTAQACIALTVVCHSAEWGQQLWAGSIVRRVATVRLQHNINAMDDSSGTATVPNDATAWRHTTNRA
jgi:hypothetical protein